MAIPSTGPVSLGTVQGEFGGANPISISEYYRGGARVPNTSQNAPVATSGAISLGSFRGTVAYVADLVPDPINWNNFNVDSYEQYAFYFWPGVTISGLSEPIVISFNTTDGFISSGGPGGASLLGATSTLQLDVVRGGTTVSSPAWSFTRGSTGSTGSINQTLQATVQNGDVLSLSVNMSVDAPDFGGAGGSSVGYTGAAVTVRNVSSANTVLDTFSYNLSVEGRAGSGDI